MLVFYDNQAFPEAAVKASWQARQFLISVQIWSFYGKDLQAQFFFIVWKKKTHLSQSAGSFW